MSNLFPTVWELLIPTFSIWTILGFVLIILGALGVWGNIGLLFNTKKIGISDSMKFYITMILVGILLVWGVSGLQKFLRTEGGLLIFWGSIIVLVIGFILFWKPSNKKGSNGGGRIRF